MLNYDFTGKEVVKEVFGVIEDIGKSNDNSVTYIKINTNDPDEGQIIISYFSRDYSSFHVGQRVIYSSFCWIEEATIDDKMRYASFGRKCPEFVTRYDFILEDEQSYYERKNSSKVLKLNN